MSHDSETVRRQVDHRDGGGKGAPPLATAPARPEACPHCDHAIGPDKRRTCPRCGRKGHGTLDHRQDSWVGRLLDDRYRLKEVIGRGGMGVVYLADHIRIGRQVAIKIVDIHGRHPSAVRRLEREARAITLIGHDNIVAIWDFGLIEAGSAFLAMEWLVGQTIEERLRQQKTLPLQDVTAILIEAAYALEAAHRCGVVHRDIKPANIFLARKGGRSDVVKLLDFGIAALRTPTGMMFDSDRQTIVGTPGYISPEAAKGYPVDQRADIYALAVTMYEMLSGEPIFGTTDPVQSLLMTLHNEPAPLRALVPNLPCADRVDDLLRHALCKSHEQRLDSAQAFRRRLVEIRAALNHPTRRAAERDWGTPRRQPLTFWLRRHAEVTVIELAGAIDERAAFDRVTEQIRGSTVEIRLARITQINSTGYIRWRAWIAQLLQRGLQLSFHACPPVVIRQANINPAFFGGATPCSFILPLSCSSCEEEQPHLVDTDDVRQSGLPEQRCPRCQQPLLLNDIADHYLAFLQDAPAERDSGRQCRLAKALPVCCALPNAERRLLHFTRLSLRGGFIWTMQPPPVGARLTLELVPSADSTPLTLQAQVTHVLQHPGDPEENGFGVVFFDAPPAADRVLAQLIAGRGTRWTTRERSLPTSERRQFARVPVRQRGVVVLSQQSAEAQVLDLSFAGARIDVEDAPSVRVGDLVTLALPHGPPEEMLRVRGRVVRISAEQPTEWGIAFAEVSHKLAAALDALLFTQLASDRNVTGGSPDPPGWLSPTA